MNTMRMAKLLLLSGLVLLLSGCSSEHTAIQEAPEVEVAEQEQPAPSTPQDTDVPRDMSAVDHAVEALEAAGYTVSYSVVEVGGTCAFGYQADELFYPASAIKGPYAVALYEKLGASYTSASALVRATIVHSDNAAFDKLHEQFGNTFFREFAERAHLAFSGYKNAGAWSARWYPKMNTEEMCKLWEACVPYLTSDVSGAEELRGYFLSRTQSPLKDVVPDSLTKAGWYPSGSGDTAPATGDSGLITKNGKTYAISIMTNMPSALEKLKPLAKSLCDCL